MIRVASPRLFRRESTSIAAMTDRIGHVTHACALCCRPMTCCRRVSGHENSDTDKETVHCMSGMMHRWVIHHARWRSIGRWKHCEKPDGETPDGYLMGT